ALAPSRRPPARAPGGWCGAGDVEQPTSAAAYGLRQGEEGRPVVRRQPARQYRAAQGAEARLPHALSRADGEDACRGSRGLASSTTCATPSQPSCSAAEWTRTSLARQPLEMAAVPGTGRAGAHLERAAPDSEKGMPRGGRQPAVIG